MGSCLSCWNKKKTSPSSRGGLQEPLYSHKSQSDDISLPKGSKDNTGETPYQSPPHIEEKMTSEEDIDVNISTLDDGNGDATETFSDEAIPPMGPKATLTGWLHYKTGALFTTYQRAFFVIQDGYLYTYKRPKSDASSAKDMLEDPLDLVGGICDKLAFPDRPYCIDVRNVLVLDAYSAAQQTQWVQAISAAIDEVSLDYLMGADGSDGADCREALSMWFGRMLGRRSNAVIILQQQYVVTKHFIKTGFHRSHDRILQLDSAGEKIVWTGMDGGKGRDSTKNSHGRDDGKSIALASITEVAEGCETAALSGVPVNRQSYCFTVYSSDRELDVEMEDSATRAVWVKNIRQIMLADRVIAGMEAVGKPRLARQQRPSTIIRKTNLKDAMSKARQHTMPQAHI